MVHQSTRAAVSVAVAVLGMLSLFTLPVLGQFTSGDIIGTIRDPTGSVIPNAKVAVTNERTNAARTVSSDSMGNYEVRQLQQDSTYRVDVERNGFKKSAISGIVVGTAQVKRVDIVLSVGDVVESVEVNDSAPAIQSESPTIGIYTPTIAIEKPIVPTPNYGIPVYSLAWQPGSAAGTQAHTLFNGSRLSQHSTNVDGVKYNMFSRGGPMEAIQDVQAVTLNAPAEFDRAIVMNVIYQGGTRKFHGEFQTAYRSPWMNAREWHSHVPRKIGNAGLPRWQYSASVGGPVLIPRLKDRMFFNFTYQKDPSTATIYPVVRSVPTLAMQRGDFSKYSKRIADPFSGQLFPNNIIPESMITQAAKAFVEDWYGSRWDYTAPDSFTNNATTIGRGRGFARAYSVKVDYNLTEKNVFGFTGYNTSEGGTSERLGNSGNWVATGTDNPYTVELQSAHYTRTFTPTIVNQLRVGHYRNGSFSTTIDPKTKGTVFGDQFIARLGLRGVPASPNVSGGPNIIFAGEQWPSLGPVFSGGRNFNNNMQIYDNLTIIRGTHTVKAGFQGIKYFRDGVANSASRFGRFDFDGRYSSDSFSDLLLGLPTRATRWRPRGASIAERMLEFGAFVQDDFRATRRLTLSYGLRWGMFTVPEDANGLYYNVDTSGPVAAIVVPDEHARQNVNPAWPTSDIPVKLAGEAGFPPKLLPRSMAWQPRLGFAFRPLGTAGMVIRGGYGIYTFSLNEQSGTGLLQTGGPFAIDEEFINTAVGQQSFFRWPDAFPPGVVRLRGSNVSLLAYAKNWRVPYTQQWNLTFEKQLPHNWGVRLSYVGTKSTQLSYPRSANIPPVSTVPWSDARRPWQNIRNLTIRENGGNDRYQAMQIVFQHPWANGLWINAGYTYSWSKTDAHPTTFELAGATVTTDYAYDRQRDTGANRFWPRHDFVASYVYDVPLGTGRNVAKNLRRNTWAGKVFNAVAGNWTASGYFSIHSGSFFTPTYSGADPGNINQFTGRPNLKAGCDPMAGGRTHGQWFNAACYEIPGPGQLGNTVVNSLVGPGQWILTLNPYKEFPLGIREGMKIRIGASIWNILNHPSFSQPVANIRDANVGKILSDDWQRSWGPFRGSRKILIIAKFMF